MTLADGGAILNGPLAVVVEFRARRFRSLARLRWAARMIEREIAHTRSGYLGGATKVELKARRVRSISIWADQPSLLSIGNCRRHVRAAHYAMRSDIEFSSTVFQAVGSWPEVAASLLWKHAQETSPSLPALPIKKGV